VVPVCYSSVEATVCICLSLGKHFKTCWSSWFQGCHVRHMMCRCPKVYSEPCMKQVLPVTADVKPDDRICGDECSLRSGRRSRVFRAASQMMGAALATARDLGTTDSITAESSSQTPMRRVCAQCNLPRAHQYYSGDQRTGVTVRVAGAHQCRIEFDRTPDRAYWRMVVVKLIAHHRDSHW
jgi:hypothetical protein